VFGIDVVRPLLLAGGLALMWFVQFQEAGVDKDAPPWGVVLVLGVRLFVDIIGAWLAVSILRLILALARIGLAQLRHQWHRQS
jgi:hypothetical protein